MGSVWLADDDQLPKPVALKFPSFDNLDAPFAIERLKKETIRARDLTHKNIVRIHDWVADPADAGACAISMEYVKGRTLAKWREKLPDGFADAGDLLPIARQICDALAYAHQNGIIHRDLKPGNIMLREDDGGNIMLRADDMVKIMDFGLAGEANRLTATDVRRAGTPGYMSPQQYDGVRAALTDDIYSIGVVLYELLAGAMPPWNRYLNIAARRIEVHGADVVANRPPVPKHWETTIAACLDEDTDKRPQSVDEVWKRLSGAKPHRSKLGIGAIALALAAVVAIAALNFFQKSDNAPKPATTPIQTTGTTQPIVTIPPAPEPTPAPAPQPTPAPAPAATPMSAPTDIANAHPTGAMPDKPPAAIPGASALVSGTPGSDMAVSFSTPPPELPSGTFASVTLALAAPEPAKSVPAAFADAPTVSSAPPTPVSPSGTIAPVTFAPASIAPEPAAPAIANATPSVSMSEPESPAPATKLAGKAGKKRMSSFTASDSAAFMSGTPEQPSPPPAAVPPPPVAGETPVAVLAAGSAHSLIITGDGKLWTMGLNRGGLLGDGTNKNHNTPVQIATTSNVTTVSAGDAHNLYVTSDGKLWAMGLNNFGQLGDGTIRGGSDTPVDIDSNVVTAAAGEEHSLYVTRDGKLRAVGGGVAGQLGDGAHTNQRDPVDIASDVTAVAAGGSHSLYLTSDGKLWAMGANTNGQISGGAATTPRYYYTPVQIASDVTTMAAGGSHSLYVTRDGKLWAMGMNRDGQLGDGTTANRNAPVQIATTSHVIAVAAGNSHSLFITSDGKLWAMGLNDKGQLGDGTTRSRRAPVEIASDVIAVAAGAHHSLFETSDGKFWAMGSNQWGQLGDGTNTDQLSPVQVQVQVNLPEPAASVISWSPAPQENPQGELPRGGKKSSPQSTSPQSAAPREPKGGKKLSPRGTSPQSTLPRGGKKLSPASASGATDTLHGVGVSDVNAITRRKFGIPDNITGVVVNGIDPRSAAAAAGLRLGDVIQGINGEPVANAAAAIRLTQNPSSRITSVRVWSRGAIHSVVVDETESANQQAVHVTLVQPPRPPAVVPRAAQQKTVVAVAPPVVTPRVAPQKTVVAVAAGGSHSLFVTSDGKLWTMGLNRFGQIGDDTRKVYNRQTPAPVASNVIAVAAGSRHSLYVTSDGALWTLGQSVFGGFANGTGITDQPVQIAANVTGVAAGSVHSLFVTGDGKLWDMGGNRNGSLGDGTTSSRGNPVPITSNVIKTAAGLDHSLYVTGDGALWATGRNNYGQLGDGTTTPYRVFPVKVTSNVIAVAAGVYHSLYITRDGTLWAMGCNENGQLGDGTTTSRRAPVKIASGVIAVAAGNFHSLYVTRDGTLWAMGLNRVGQLGDGTTTDRHSPVKITSNVTLVAAGGVSEGYQGQSLYVTRDGKLWAMGSNQWGQLGDGTTTDRHTPVPVEIH